MYNVMSALKEQMEDRKKKIVPNLDDRNQKHFSPEVIAKLWQMQQFWQRFKSQFGCSYKKFSYEV